MENNSEMKREELNNLEKNLVMKLNEIKDIMDAQKNTLAVSVRRDVIAVQLKDILDENTSFYSLKSALEEYIKSLYSNIEVKEVTEDEDNNQE